MTYLNFVVERARFGRQQSAHLDSTGGRAAPFVAGAAAAASAAAGHVGGSALCGQGAGAVSERRVG